MLGLVNDWVGIWLGQVLQQVQLQERDPLAVVGDEGGEFGSSWVVCGSGRWGMS